MHDDRCRRDGAKDLYRPKLGQTHPLEPGAAARPKAGYGASN
jgi:hypothetical protein